MLRCVRAAKAPAMPQHACIPQALTGGTPWGRMAAAPRREHHFTLKENACPRSPPWSRSGQWPQWRCQFLKTQPRHIDESYNTHPWTFWPRGFSANSVLVCPAGPLLVPMRHLLRQGGAARGQALACGGAPGPQGGPTVPEAPRAPKAQSWVRLSSSPVLPRKVVGGGGLALFHEMVVLVIFISFDFIKPNDKERA